MYVYILLMYPGQKKTLDPLKLELQMVVSHHVGAENRTSSSGRAASVLNDLSSLARCSLIEYFSWELYFS